MSQLTEFVSHRGCFACGRQTVDGLGLVFAKDNDGLRCKLRVDSRFQSYRGIVHGGILATVADATMVNLVFRRYGGHPVTGCLKVRYRQPVRVNEQIVVKATIHHAKLGSVWTGCRIAAGDLLCVEADAVFRILSNQVE